jgi:hypothetical protein
MDNLNDTPKTDTQVKEIATSTAVHTHTLPKPVEPKEPIHYQKNITLVFIDGTGSMRRQTTHVHNQTAADLLKFLNLPPDGQRIVTGRAGQAIGLDEKVYDHVDNGADVNIVLHPEAMVLRHGGPNIFPLDAAGRPIAFNPTHTIQVHPDGTPVNPSPIDVEPSSGPVE